MAPRGGAQGKGGERDCGLSARRCGSAKPRRHSHVQYLSNAITHWAHSMLLPTAGLIPCHASSGVRHVGTHAAPCTP